MGSSPTRGDTNGIWSYSVMVITLDSESSDPGSSPGRTLFFSAKQKFGIEKKNMNFVEKYFIFLFE